MICNACINTPSPECKDKCEYKGDTCFCQHKETEKLPDGTVAPKGVKRDVR